MKSGVRCIESRAIAVGVTFEYYFPCIPSQIRQNTALFRPFMQRLRDMRSDFDLGCGSDCNSCLSTYPRAFPRAHTHSRFV